MNSILGASLPNYGTTDFSKLNEYAAASTLEPAASSKWSHLRAKLEENAHAAVVVDQPAKIDRVI